LYAITDIETVGSAPGEGTIIEIAICLHDGEKIVDRYETLINPEKNIPPFIVSLTGINQTMLRRAPVFEEVADEIYDMLKEAVFVAHNVNFDFGFIKAEFDALGIVWKPQRLCTVRLARKSFPGHHKYGLSSICERLEIPNFSAHRAMGDAQATAILFDKCSPTAVQMFFYPITFPMRSLSVCPPRPEFIFSRMPLVFRFTLERPTTSRKG
jgi:DNA polymerase-3 subunit epsilon